MTFRWLPLAFLALLPACAAQEACQAAHGIALPVAMVAGQPHLPVRLNGKPATMLLDTGANVSVLTPMAVQRLGIARDPQISS